MQALKSGKTKKLAALAPYAGKYLTFALGNEFFGIAIDKVQEIIGRMEITPVPRLPETVLGVINLRGQVIPVVSQRRAFELNDVDANARECIIVVHLGGDEEEAAMLGALVDTVSEVIDVHVEDIEPAPRIGTTVKSDFIVGMAKVRERVVTLLDIDRVYGEQTMEVVARATQQVELAAN